MRSRISIRGCVRPSVRPSVRWLVTHELKSCKSAVFDQNYWQYEREHILCRVYGLVTARLASSVSLWLVLRLVHPFTRPNSKVFSYA